MKSVAEKKIRSDCVNMAKCGLTSMSRCKGKRAGLAECDGCKLVARVADRWKMIDRKPHKKCSYCGEFLPLERFYPKKNKKPNGKVYESEESICKMCRSRKRYDEKKKAT